MVHVFYQQVHCEQKGRCRVAQLASRVVILAHVCHILSIRPTFDAASKQRSEKEYTVRDVLLPAPTHPSISRTPILY